jgi:hypothetical protein
MEGTVEANGVPRQVEGERSDVSSDQTHSGRQGPGLTSGVRAHGRGRVRAPVQETPEVSHPKRLVNLHTSPAQDSAQVVDCSRKVSRGSVHEPAAAGDVSAGDRDPDEGFVLDREVRHLFDEC